MKILVVDHNALNPLQRSVYRMLNDYDDVELRIVVPRRWFDNYRMRFSSECVSGDALDIHASRVLFPSKTHRLVYLDLRKELRSFRPDIFYMNAEPENFQTLHAVLHSRKESGKFVFSSWRNIDHSVVGYPYKLGFINASIERFVLSCADHCIAFNRSAREIYERLGFTRVTVIPPPVDTAVFIPAPGQSESETAPLHPYRIGFIGRLIETKGVDVLLKAVARLPFPCEVSLVGDGPAKSAWLSLVRELKLERQVHIAGAVEPEEIPGYLNKMDIVVLPSRTSKHWKEQFGRILVEAMACGVPVIGSTSGEIPNVIGNAGLVFKEGDEEALALGLQRILTNPQLRTELSRRGLDRARSKYSVEAITPLYHSLFKSLMESSQSPDSPPGSE